MKSILLSRFCICFASLIFINTVKADALYLEKNFAIYPSSEYWCSSNSTRYTDNITLDVIYNVPNEKRNAVVFGGSSASSYTRFFNNVITPLIAKKCPYYSGFTPKATLRLNTRSDWLANNFRYWDKLRFSYTKNPRYKSGFSGYYIGHYLSEEAKTDKLKQKQQTQLIASKQRKLDIIKGRPFASLSAGPYLESIYQGDFVAQNELAWYYLSKINQKNKNNAAMGILLSYLGSLSGKSRTDVTVLEEITMYYLKRSSERPNSCFDRGAVKRTFTYNFPEIIYSDGYRIPASQTRSTYKINARFNALCDRLCERQGVLYAVAHGMNEGMKTLEIANLFRGVDEMLKHFNCRSPEIKQFEANLIKFNQKEYAQPANIRRNTFKEVIKAPKSLYVPYALQPHSSIASKFMAENSTKPGVVATVSGLQYIMIKKGQGRHPGSKEKVTIRYTGMLSTGRVISKKHATTPETRPVNHYVRGMAEGIQLLQPGGKIKLFIPPQLGFGTAAKGVINKDSILIYEIELISDTNIKTSFPLIPTAEQKIHPIAPETTPTPQKKSTTHKIIPATTQIKQQQQTQQKKKKATDKTTTATKS